MSDSPTKAQGPSKAGSESSVSPTKPSIVSNQAKIADDKSDENIVPAKESLLSELCPNGAVNNGPDYDKYNFKKYDSDDDGMTDDSNNEPVLRKIDAEVHRHVLPGEPQGVYLSVFINKEEEGGSWLDNILVECYYKGKIIGNVLGRYIHRQGITNRFYEAMDGTSQEMANIAVGVFDKFGRLNKKFKGKGVQRGTGIWGSELDVGPLCFIEELQISNRQWRRKGLGRAIVKALIQKAQKQAAPYRRLHIVVQPGVLTDDISRETYGKSESEAYKIHVQAMKTAITFFRSLGFRRIGTSSCFCFSLDPEHKTHSLAASADYDPPKADSKQGISDDEDDAIVSTQFDTQELNGMRMAKLKERFPLKYAALTLPDYELFEFLDALESKDSTAWNEVDTYHNNVLHHTGYLLKVQSTQWLIENIDQGQGLRLARNLNGLTPLEALQGRLEKRRTSSNFMGVISDESDRFEGFTPEAVACLSLLLYGSMPSFLPRDQVRRLKYGCTCGECIEGFISPRMKETLISHAACLQDNFESMVDLDTVDSLLSTPIMAKVLPQALKNRIARRELSLDQFESEFTALSDHIKGMLWDDEVTAVGIVAAEDTYHDIDEIKAALGFIIETARLADYNVEDYEPTEMFDEDLKACRNDHEHEMVRLALGLCVFNRGS